LAIPISKEFNLFFRIQGFRFLLPSHPQLPLLLLIPLINEELWIIRIIDKEITDFFELHMPTPIETFLVFNPN